MTQTQQDTIDILGSMLLGWAAVRDENRANSFKALLICTPEADVLALKLDQAAVAAEAKVEEIKAEIAALRF